MRLAGQTLLGYFPAPPEAVAMAAARLRAPAGDFAMLDPCAGEGAAVAQLSQLLGCRPELVCAIELDEHRAAAVKAALPQGRVLAPAAVAGCRASYGSFSLAYVNPPFDHAFDGGRVEAEFLRQVTPWIMGGGVLALVCPESVAQSYGVRNHLLQWYDSFTVLPFPDGCRNFKEVVVLAVRRKEPAAWHEQKKWDDAQAPAGHVYAIPAGAGPKVFEKFEPTVLEVKRALAGSPLRKHLKAPPEFRLPAPPLALGKGHIALLLAAGHLDGIVAAPGELPHAVRGTAKKVKYVFSESETEDDKGNVTTKTVYREKIQLVVRAADAAGRLYTFEEVGRE